MKKDAVIYAFDIRETFLDNYGRAEDLSAPPRIVTVIYGALKHCTVL